MYLLKQGDIIEGDDEYYHGKIWKNVGTNSPDSVGTCYNSWHVPIRRPTLSRSTPKRTTEVELLLEKALMCLEKNIHALYTDNCTDNISDALKIIRKEHEGK
jgi:hypothetical protein